ncbi:MAG TPA: YbjN domain-containing protein [Mycobacteriales bacterium]|nr:YbjN domain-containing protein [Mycobacteriales bacterium]
MSGPGPVELERVRLDRVIKATLDELELAYERTAEGSFLVTLVGEHRLQTMTWLVVGDHSLRVEAFFMRKPEDNEAETYRYLLQRNARTYGVAFSCDVLGDVFLTGHVPLAAVSAAEVDRLLGCVLSYSDGTFDAAVRLGFRGSIDRERAYRAKLAAQGEPLAPNPLLDD